MVISSILKVTRPIHWIKNLSLFAAIFLTGLLNNNLLLTKLIWAFFAFNFATSATYIINDILDAKHDRLHPVKKHRPIASGDLPILVAIVEAVVLATLALVISAGLNQLFFLLVVGYLVMQLFYSLGLKNLPVIDILVIATGFIMRVYAGAFVIDAHLSVWFLLCVISVALFLASGKRRAELNVLKSTNEITRTSLTRYKKELLNSYVTMFGNASWMSWALYTFFESPKASLPFWLVLAEISKTTTVNKLLMATIPIVIFGIMRYESLIFEDKSEAPEKVLLTDKGLIVAVTLWVSIVYWVLYSGISVSGI
ncbi:MAG: decaprenyl-phosphate phosphoribosyltransferase [Microgenomates group bacterium]